MIEKKTVLGFVVGIFFTLFISFFTVFLTFYFIQGVVNLDSVEYSSPVYDQLQKNYQYDHILSVGSTFEYDSNNVILLDDILHDSVANIVLVVDGIRQDNAICIENSLCSIGNIKFQIDDIHKGDEFSYLVYWMI